MNYLQSHKDTLIPEFREVWAANGYKKSGTWEEVFGPGKPASLEIPIQTTVSLLGPLEHENSWQHLHWVSDEIFMAWNYAHFLEKVVQAGKAAYDIPMYVNAWLQQPNHAWPGTYPSGGPLPQVHDIWRAGAPDIDILAPDLYLDTLTISASASSVTAIRSSFPKRVPIPPMPSWLSASTTPSDSLPSALTETGPFYRILPPYMAFLISCRP
jgi:hypothetical protein